MKEIKAEILAILQDAKNLLAFSHGSDSTALFYALLKQKIPFDLAFVNYKKRAQSDIEEKSARNLARKFNKEIFVKIAPKIKKDFQNEARKFRYDFFTEICVKFKYENLILAHNFNDKFEWFLMQLGRGAGILELLGMSELEKRDKFTLVRPLLSVEKREILAFLENEKIKFFKDESNESEEFGRNFIRKRYAVPFLEHFKAGVMKSFSFLQKDAKNLLNAEILEFNGILKCVKFESLIAKAVKKFGVVMSENQRKECLKNDCVISGKICVVYYENFALIFKHKNDENLAQKMQENSAKFKQKNDINFQKNHLNLNEISSENPQNLSKKMPKEFKEKCRILKIPPKLRLYLHKNEINLDEFMHFLQG